MTPGKPFPAASAVRPSSHPSNPAVDPKAAVDALRRRYEESLAHTRSRQTAPSVPSVEAALAKEQLHATAIARAKEAEEKRDFADAGANWARAFDLVAAAEVAHRAALCFRRAGVEPRRAAHYGEEAVKLDPNKASYRVNLALLYADLGLLLRARGEIDRAQALDPQGAGLKEALARIKALK